MGLQAQVVEDLFAESASKVAADAAFPESSGAQRRSARGGALEFTAFTRRRCGQCVRQSEYKYRPAALDALIPLRASPQTHLTQHQNKKVRQSQRKVVKMEMNVEARRILAVSISKLYASRSQRGGLRLHRSLLVSLVMKSARDIYHSTAALVEKAAESCASTEDTMEAMDTAENPENQPQRAEDKENQSPKRPRKRPGKVSAVPDFLPEKRARLEPGEERHEAGVNCSPSAPCRSALVLVPNESLLNRVIPAF
ncbi:hypothetical protein WMY93_007001 [Mugilogobius chulae]|uniref:Immediate early response 2 n=1 Tax=Mugilogobius chulae TaxID=88201 RepID=A0AAW0PNY8_9GOBI